jgi:hypothetical protein
MKTNKLIKLLLLIITIYFSLNYSVFTQENKQISFITGVGSSYREADVNAHNTAYMSGLKIISKSINKSGEIWVVTVKTVSRH